MKFTVTEETAEEFEQLRQKYRQKLGKLPGKSDCFAYLVHELLTGSRPERPKSGPSRAQENRLCKFRNKDQWWKIISAVRDSKYHAATDGGLFRCMCSIRSHGDFRLAQDGDEKEFEAWVAAGEPEDIDGWAQIK